MTHARSNLCVQVAEQLRASGGSRWLLTLFCNKLEVCCLQHEEQNLESRLEFQWMLSLIYGVTPAWRF